MILIDGAPDPLLLLNKQNMTESAEMYNAEIQISILTSILNIYKIKISEKVFFCYNTFKEHIFYILNIIV